ncbi:MAG: Gldg family protein [Phycisphaerae bacterium]|nr:Gldg family protein [Phycisphaerae bacterium]
MAIDKENKTTEASSEPVLRFKGRQWIVGANVLVVVVLSVGLLVFANYLAFRFNSKSDWTSTGVNSIGEQTQKLLDGLDQEVTLTSLYQTFQDPTYDAEARKFRTAVDDMLQLYQTERPSKINVASINPAKDRDKILALVDRLRKKTAYQGEAKKHKALIETFTNKLSGEIGQLLANEKKVLQEHLDKSAELGSVREYGIILRNCQILAQQADRVKEDVAALTGDELPKYTAAVDAIKGYYEQLKAALTEGGKWMADVDNWAKRNKIAKPADAAFFTDAPKRYAKLIDEVGKELDKAKDLPKLKLEDLDREVRPDTIIVETSAEARVLSFDDVWPPRERGQFGQPQGSGFDSRKNAGELQISSAVLQLTQKEKTAVIFVRHGGQPLFFGGFMMGGRQAPYAAAKERLERANFIVKEWDVGAKKEPPEFEDGEKPTRTIWVLLKPEAQEPPPGMPPQMRQRPKMFGPPEREAVERAMGENPRVLVISGWIRPQQQMPMMMAPPPSYEYNDWLKDKWGVEVQYGYPVLEWTSFEPGKMVPRGDPTSISRHYELTEQMIVEPLRSLKAVFPDAAPIKKQEKLPDGETIEELVVVPNRDDVWAESDFQGLVQEFQQKQSTSKGKMDVSGPFPIAIAAEKTQDGKVVSKMVLISSLRFAMDAVAQQMAVMRQADRLVMALNNPGNMDLFVNSIHWLNDNAGMIGKGIESRDIPRLYKLEPGTGQTIAKALAVAIWPAMALVAGLAVWFVRRR